MISQQALFTQMELKLQQAKAAQNEAKMREALSALQALCNVVLDSSVSAAVVGSVSVPTQQSAPPVMMQQVQPSEQTKQVNEIDEANGASIFDF